MSRPDAVNKLTMNVLSTAIALEALETLLVEKKILKDDELMTRAKQITIDKTLRDYEVHEKLSPMESVNKNLRKIQ